MRLLLHACCAPCANRPIESLRQEGMAVTGFWFNPNIHPYTEYQARKSTLEKYAKEIGMKLIIGGTYDLRPWIEHVAGNIDGRCAYCYQVRMEETAGMPPKTDTRALLPRCWCPPIRSTTPSGPSPRPWGKNMASPSSIGIFVPCSSRARSLHGSTGCTCRNTAAVFSARRTAIWAAKRKKKAARAALEGQK